MKILILLLCFLIAGETGDRGDVQAGKDAPAAPRISPDKLDFGVQNIGNTTGPRTLTLANPGPSMLHIASVLASGIDFLETDNCGTSLAAGSQCSIQITFKPATIGQRLGQLSVTSSVPVQPRSVPLSGTGE